MARLTTEDAVCEAKPLAGHRVVVFSYALCAFCGFSKTRFQKITKSLYLVRCFESIECDARIIKIRASTKSLKMPHVYSFFMIIIFSHGGL